MNKTKKIELVSVNEFSFVCLVGANSNLTDYQETVLS